MGGLENYEVKELIGKGTYGKVHKGIRKSTGQFVAMKFIMDVSSKEDLKKQLQILSKIKHDNIVQILDFFDSAQGFCIVTELALGYLSEVFKRDEGLSEEEVQKIAKQLVGALRYLHSKGIVHCDLKPQNILICAGDVAKISDFGVARLISPNTIALQANTGTLHYMAPEVITCKFYNCTADLWSLGLILFELFGGRLPCSISSRITDIMMWHMKENLVKYPDTMSSTFRSFLIGLLGKNPSRRLKWRYILKHPFVAKTSQDMRDRELHASTAGTRVCDAALKGKTHIQTTRLASVRVGGHQLLDRLENNSCTFEEVKVIVQDKMALSTILQPLKCQLFRDEDVPASNKSLNIISNLVDAGAINSPRIVYKFFWPLIDFTDRLIIKQKSDYDALLIKCFVVVRKLLVKNGSGFGASYTYHWVAILDLFKKVGIRTEEVAYGKILCESIGCITAIASSAAQEAHKGILYFAREKGVVDALLSFLVTCGTSLMSLSLDFLPAACEACSAIWSILSISEIWNTKESALVFPLSAMHSHSSNQLNVEGYECDKTLNGAYYEIIVEAVTKRFLVSESLQYAFYSCLCSSSEGTLSSVIQIILRCCSRNNAVSGVLCGFASSLPVTTVVSGGDDRTIVSEIFSKLSCYARDPQTVMKREVAYPDALVRDLCLLLATVAQSLKSVGRTSAQFILTSSPEKQHSRLSDLAHHYDRMQDSRPSVMLALASIFSLESSGTSSISKIALPLIPDSTKLYKYISTVLTEDGIGSMLSAYHGFRDAAVGLLEARLNWNGASDIQQLCASGFPRTLIDLLGGCNHSSQNQIGLSPFGVVWTVSLLCRCLEGGSSTFRQRFLTRKHVKSMAYLISDVHLQLIRCWGGPGGGINGVRDTVNAVINFLSIPFVALENVMVRDTEANIEKYIQLLLRVRIPEKIIKCLEHVELKDATRLAAFLAKMTLHRSLVVQLLDKGLLDPGIMKKLLGISSPREVTLKILRILSNLACMDKEFYEHIKRADILPFLNKFLTHEYPNVREEACYAISKMCWHSDYFYHELAKHKIISLLVRCYSNPDKKVRYRAGFAISNAAFHNDLLHKELSRCIPQVAKDLRLSTKKKYRKLVENACYILRHLVRNSDKFCKEIISEGAMEALLKLVVRCTSEACNQHKENSQLLDVSLKTLAELCKHSPCIQFFHSSVHFSEIKQFCQTSELQGAALVSRMFNKTVNRKSDLAEG